MAIHSKNQNYSARLSYSNALNLIFANIGAEYWASNNNITYSSSYKGALTYIESIAKLNKSNGYNIKGTFSKQIMSLFTLVSIGGSWGRYWSDIIRQDVLINTCNNFYTAEIGFNTRFANWISMEYNAHYIKSVSEATLLDKDFSVENFKQSAEIVFSPIENIIASVNGQHYYNTLQSYKNSNMFFLGAQIMYKAKNIIYSLEGRNLLNTKIFKSSYITDFRYSYMLRPNTIIATIKFNF